VIPVIDLKARFGLPESEQTDESRILVIHVGGNTTSIIVDAVKEVLRIGRDQIAPPPPTVANLGREYLLGLVKLDDQLLILLDIERLLSIRARDERRLASGRFVWPRFSTRAGFAVRCWQAAAGPAPMNSARV